ncbi:MAG TPA: SGNH/GDSL hydrolase family protein [Kribbella sp.]|uniref:SGNH/GDSL hydrolase family protein n=1 Tax=Kribbella sp. TaxID=1871183 RepID=UPI002D787ED3|nr:SGNH/GDSL hydrolase family protein [Kribbella sp.]HET6295876.1 SGNH/GDSL hydrolase family protein [Kribbella sp.]
MTVRIRSGSTVLFIGDSITDVGRDRSNGDDLGGGYPSLVAEQFALSQNLRDVHVLNRGIGGNRICDLRERWDADCLKLKPDLISVLVGINDAIHADKGDGTPTVDDYQADYQTMLQSARRVNPAVQLVLIEPFLLPVRDEQRETRTEVDQRIAVVQRMAADFGATLLAADPLFTQAAAASSTQEWCPDGVHPTPAGHSLLADAWLEVTHSGQSSCVSSQR